MLGKLTLARVKAGQTLIEEGDHNKDLFVILSGSLAVYKHNRLLKTLPAGSTVGEMSLFGTARTATVKAVEETDLLQMKRSCFNELVGGNTRLGVKLLWRISAALARRLDDASS